MNSTLSWNELQASHEDLSAADWRFRQLACKDRDCLMRATFDRPHPLRSLVLHDLQPWPVFVGRRKRQELAEAGRGISGLVRSLPRRVFHNDPRRIAEFYGLDDLSFTAAVLAPPDGIAEAISRGDFVAGTSGLQCVEFNCTGHLGGWESAIMADLLLRVPVMDRFIRELGLKVSVANTLRLMLSYAFGRAHAAGLGDGDEINMGLVATQEAKLFGNPLARQVFDREYRAARRQAAPQAAGSFLLVDGPACELRHDRLYFQGKPMHSLIIGQRTDAEAIILKAFKKGNLHVYNNPSDLVLGDKRNLALLSELGETGLFDPAERAVVRRHVPWTRRVAAGKCVWRGETVVLPELLISRRRHLVLKKARSYGGLDVAIGRLPERAPWASAVRAALASGDWIAQEFVESRPYLFQEEGSGCSPHDLVWGVFVFGDTYGGASVRVLPKAARGLVSATRGAAKSVFLELDE